eukprot:m.516807 g.516807  ORF g.516807 m.516807 type:complete len:253 (+) comp21933_c0_seq2:202-960(+)
MSTSTRQNATASDVLHKVSSARTELEESINALMKITSGTTKDFRDADTRAREALDVYESCLLEADKTARSQTAAARSKALADALTEKLSDERDHLKLLIARRTRARRMALLATQKSQREDLFDGNLDAMSPESRNTAKESTQMTAKLRAARAQLSAEVDTSLAALQRLHTDGKVLGEVNTKMQGLGTELDDGNKILRTYRRKDCIDRLLIGLAVVVYVLVVVWILYRRLGIRRIVEFFAPLLPYIGSDEVCC